MFIFQESGNVDDALMTPQPTCKTNNEKTTIPTNRWFTKTHGRTKTLLIILNITTLFHEWPCIPDGC
jgi:hypothetical protein